MGKDANIRLLLSLYGQSQWPRGLRRGSTAARLLPSWVRIPAGAWMFVCLCCVLSGRGLCDELITRPRGVLPTVARRCVWSGNLVWWWGHNHSHSHSPRWAAEPEKINNNNNNNLSLYVLSKSLDVLKCRLWRNLRKAFYVKCRLFHVLRMPQEVSEYKAIIWTWRSQSG
jgi:hypothetical protein